MPSVCSVPGSATSAASASAPISGPAVRLFCFCSNFTLEAVEDAVHRARSLTCLALD